MPIGISELNKMDEHKCVWAASTSYHGYCQLSSLKPHYWVYKIISYMPGKKSSLYLFKEVVVCKILRGGKWHAIKTTSYHIINAIVHFSTTGMYTFSKINMNFIQQKWYR